MCLKYMDALYLCRFMFRLERNGGWNCGNYYIFNHGDAYFHDIGIYGVFKYENEGTKDF